MTRGRRFFGQVAMLGLMAVVLEFNETVFFLAVSGALIVAPAFNLAVAGVLVWTSRQAPEIATLRERADDAGTLLLISLAGAALGLITLARVLGVIETVGRPGLLLVAYALVLASIPALGWLGTWRDVWLPALRKRRA